MQKDETLAIGNRCINWHYSRGANSFDETQFTISRASNRRFIQISYLSTFVVHIEDEQGCNGRDMELVIVDVP
jgi:hypothetical protein